MKLNNYGLEIKIKLPLNKSTTLIGTLF